MVGMEKNKQKENKQKENMYFLSYELQTFIFVGRVAPKHCSEDLGRHHFQDIQLIGPRGLNILTKRFLGASRATPGSAGGGSYAVLKINLHTANPVFALHTVNTGLLSGTMYGFPEPCQDLSLSSELELTLSTTRCGP